MSTTTLAPKHIGLILDGNRRWAAKRGISKLEAHRMGAELIKTIARHAYDCGVEFVTVYVFSTENWNREASEVKYLMDLLLKFFARDLDELIDENVRIRVIGSRDRLSDKVKAAIDKTEAASAHNNGKTLCLCFNYGGREEIVDAARKLVAEGARPDEITEASLRDHMYASDIPDPDMIIRTSGEQRLSGFMLYEAAYSELYFTPTPWPEFSEEELDRALEEYAHRQRRFGA